MNGPADYETELARWRHFSRRHERHNYALKRAIRAALRLLDAHEYEAARARLDRMSQEPLEHEAVPSEAR